ncbi:GSCOCG00001008001-RA-CDS, partial [Cotesia congregata]
LNSHDLGNLNYARIDYLARMTAFYSPIPKQDRSINITCKTSNTSLLTQRLERGNRFSGNLTEEDLCALNITHTVPNRCIFTAQLTKILNLLNERQKLIVQIGANGYEVKSIENLMDYIIENLNKSIQKLINAVE